MRHRPAYSKEAGKPGATGRCLQRALPAHNLARVPKLSCWCRSGSKMFQVVAKVPKGSQIFKVRFPILSTSFSKPTSRLSRFSIEVQGREARRQKAQGWGFLGSMVDSHEKGGPVLSFFSPVKVFRKVCRKPKPCS